MFYWLNTKISRVQENSDGTEKFDLTVSLNDAMDSFVVKRLTREKVENLISEISCWLWHTSQDNYPPNILDLLMDKLIPIWELSEEEISKFLKLTDKRTLVVALKLMKIQNRTDISEIIFEWCSSRAVDLMLSEVEELWAVHISSVISIVDEIASNALKAKQISVETQE
jgi:acetolactate synthase regulatory subunit